MKMSFEDKLLTVFFDYLEEVVAIKVLLETNKLEPFVNLAAIKVTDKANEEVAKNVSDRLYRFLNVMDVEIKSTYSSFEYERWLEAKYILAATVDEIFIYWEKWDRGLWMNNLLEQKVNNSRNAGVTIFNRIDNLIKDKSGEPIFIVLAKLYYFSIQVGFKGEMRNTVGGDESIKLVKQSLQRFMGNRELKKNDLFEQRKKNTGSYGQGSRIASMQPWLRMAAMTAAGYLLVSSYIWLTSIDSFHRIISQGQ